jgi:hypothetical protein
VQLIDEHFVEYGGLRIDPDGGEFLEYAGKPTVLPRGVASRFGVAAPYHGDLEPACVRHGCSPAS